MPLPVTPGPRSIWHLWHDHDNYDPRRHTAWQCVRGLRGSNLGVARGLRYDRTRDACDRHSRFPRRSRPARSPALGAGSLSPTRAPEACHDLAHSRTRFPPPRAPPTAKERRMRGADALIETLAGRGIDTVFGVPGGAVLPLYDALAGSPVRHVLMGHEAAAGHAAEGWARVSGKPGVALATSGPGAVNLLTAVADAWMDSIPTVFICGQVATHLAGTMAFQETDVAGMSIPVVKHSSTARHGEDLESLFMEAFALASAGRPGPVLVEVPVDVAKAPATRHRHPSRQRRHSQRPRSRTLTAAVELIRRSARPLLLAGGGVVASGAHAELAAFTDAAGAPYVTTLHGLECGGGRGWLGMPGVYGTRVANWALHQADCIIAVGARFDDRLTGNLDGFAPRARVIHVDADASELGKLVAAEIAICADARSTLRRLTAALGPAPDRSAWWASISNTLCDHPVA